jgi:outer membrane protein assembly factor BamA
MRRPLVLGLVAFTFFAVASFVAAQDSCDKQFVVSGVDLPTKTHLSRSEQAAIKASLIGDCFDDEQLGALTAGVQHVLESFGYLRATVSQPSITIVDGTRHPQLVSLNVEVEEGSRYKVREIMVTGYRTLDPDQISSFCQIQVDDFLDMRKVHETADALRRLYAANGFLRASIVPQVRFKERLGVSVAFQIVEGPQS